MTGEADVRSLQTMSRPGVFAGVILFCLLAGVLTMNAPARATEGVHFEAGGGVGFLRGEFESRFGPNSGLGLSSDLFRSVDAEFLLTWSTYPSPSLISTDRTITGGGRLHILHFQANLRTHFTQWHYVLLGIGGWYEIHRPLEYTSWFSGGDGAFRSAGDGKIERGPMRTESVPTIQLGLGIDIAETRYGTVFIDGRYVIAFGGTESFRLVPVRVGFRFR